MRIALDVSAIRHGLTNGVAVYTANLARALVRLDVDVVAWFCARSTLAAEAVLDELTSAGAEIVRAPAPWRWSPDGAWWLPSSPPDRALLDRVDVWHLGEFHLPTVTSTSVVATVHDLTTLTHPDHHLLVNRVVHRRRLKWIRRHARHIIAVSRSTKQDLEATIGVRPERVSVIYEARGHTRSSDREAHAEDLLLGHGIRRPYVLTVGTLEPRKNHERLVRAFESLPASVGEVDLVLVGGKGWRAGDVLRAIDASPARTRIHRLGLVSETDLSTLYANAMVFAYPSLYEGFGLPVLEAMAHGTPVLTSNVSSMAEVAGGSALLVDPGSVDSIRSGLERLVEDAELRQRLTASGRRREAAFSWMRAARETVAAYIEAMKTPVDRSSVQDHPEPPWNEGPPFR